MSEVPKLPDESREGIAITRTLINIFNTQVRKTPHLTALVSDDRQLTYAELDLKASHLAVYLYHRGVKENDIVSICLDKGFEVIISILAILKAGAAYMPVDPAFPAERIAFMLEDAKPAAIITSSEYINLFDPSVAFDVKKVLDGFTIKEENKEAIEKKTGEFTYVLFTSGSTGRPKGVLMRQKALVNLVEWQLKDSRMAEGSRTLNFSPITFDVSFQEIFTTFATGGALFLINDDLRLDAVALLNFLETHQINRLFLPFVALQMLCEAATSENIYPGSLKEVMTAGEQLKITPQVRAFFSNIKGLKLFNQYGPTEGHVVTSLTLHGGPESWPELPGIGKPIDNVPVYILDEQGKELPEGGSGELCIGGIALAEGYVNQPELTKEKFIEWAHTSGTVERIYKTGDLAKKLPDGNIEFLGRKDDQVKIRGFRIELGEIETALSQYTGIVNCVVVAQGEHAAQKRIVAYLVSRNGQKNTAEVRSFIQKRLPEYMIPSAFVWIEELPKTASGKINKKALTVAKFERPQLKVLYEKPKSDVEKNIAEVWSGLLQIDEIGAHDNFFELGGNSLLAQKTVGLLKEHFGYQLPITKLYLHPTISGIAAHLTGSSGKKRKARVQDGTDSVKGTADIAVIGMECNFPGADGIEAFWDLLVQGKEATRFFSAEELDKNIPDTVKNDPTYVKARGILDNVELFDAAFFGMSPRLAELMDPQQRLFLEVSRGLLEKTGFLTSKKEAVIGVFAGCNTNTYFNNNVIWHRDKIDLQGSVPVMSVSDKDYISSRVSYQLDLSGPAINVNTACSTSLVAIVQAVESLRSGQCDAAIAGGAAVTVPVYSGHLYQEGSMLSADGHCRPFDADAKGTVFSDGVGAVLLKRLNDAVKDGDNIYAVVKGVGINNDGGHKGSFTAPSAEGQATAISMAYEDAGIAPEKISYIETHGTATPLGDPIEIEGLKIAFGDHDKKQFCSIGSVKSNFGHLTHASGVAGFIKTVLSLHHRQLPPSINFNRPNPHIDFTSSPFIVNNTLKDWEVEGKRIAGVSSFGVGGTNAHVVVEAFEPGLAAHKAAGSEGVEVVCWSAHNEESGLAYAEKLQGFLETHTDIALRDISASLIFTRDDMGVRNFIVADSTQDLLMRLKEREAVAANAYRIKEKKTNIVFLFPGQGNQYPNMGLGLYKTEAVYKEAVDECAQILQEYMGEDIRTVIFTENNNKAAAEKLKNTRYAQPAIFTTSYALAKLYMSWGVTPAAFAGHSIGEFVGAHLAGVFSLPDVLKIVAERGRLISELPSGSMLSVRASLDKVQPLLPAELSVAAQNATELCVVSGETSLINKFSVTLTEAGIVNKPLRTSHAFHSSMMDPAIHPLQDVIATATLNVPQMPVMSTVTAAWLKDGEAVSTTYWADHARATVKFGTALKHLQEELDPLFLEVGPGTSSTIFAKQNGTGDAAFASLNISSAAADEAVSVKSAIGKLWQYGAAIDWRKIYRKAEYNLLHELPTYAYNKKRLWIEPPAQTQLIHQKQTFAQGTTETINSTSIATMNRKDILIDKLKDIIESASGISVAQSNPYSNFAELGLDSLLLTQLTTSLKKEFPIPVTFRQLSEDYDSLDKLAAFYDANLPADKFAAMEAPPAGTMPGSSINAPAMQIPAQIYSGNGQQPVGTDMLSIMSLQLQLLTQQVAMMQHGVTGPAPQFQVQNNANISADKNSNVNTADELTAEEKIELKKPFGATARIEKRSTEISEQQKKYLEDFISAYNKKMPESKKYTQVHRAKMADPRVVSGFKPYTKEMIFPIVANKSKGSYLWDIDGNKYVDALNGFGSNFLGYQPDFIKEAILKQVEEGYEIGPQHVLAGQVSDLICELTGMERAALCNTGSEAVLGAMRIARTVSGKDVIVAFSGSYHGIIDEVLVRGSKKLKTYPAASGILAGNVQNMLILEYGTEESLQIIKERADEIAAVLVEPVQSRRPEFQPVEFLRRLRRLTAEVDVALIFDEVITGFRSHLGGVQALFNIRADIATYGKVAGAGISIGIIAGSKKYMDALDGGYWQYGDSSIPEVGVTYFAGTFVRHPLALATTNAALRYLKSQGNSLQEEMNEKTGRLAARFNQIAQKYQVPVYVVHFSSLWKIKFKEDYPYYELLFALMRMRNIHIWDSFPCFLTTAHTQDDIDAICRAFEESIAELCSVGFIPQVQGTATEKNGPGIKIIDNSAPPVAGARLGKDKNGNPAWFVPDENNPGKYLQISLDEK